MAQHKIVNEFFLKGKIVITLDSVRSPDEFNTKEVIIDGKRYTYELTHNELMFVINTTESLIDKTIAFVN